MNGRIELLVEGNILQWNPNRGIPRVYREILPRIHAVCSAIHMTVACQGGAHWQFPGDGAMARKEVPVLSPRLRPWRFWSLVAPAVNRRLASSFWQGARADVYHSTSYEMPSVPGPSLALVHDMMPERFPELFSGRSWRRLAAHKRRTVEQAALVLCVSANTRNDVIQTLDVDESRCRVSHNGGFIPEGLTAAGVKPGGLSGRPFILHVGGNRVGYKNFMSVVQCVGSASRKEWREFDVVAAGPESPTQTDLAHYAPWLDPKRILFLTDCTDANLVYLYRHCMAFVMPSLYEGFGIPVIEALSCGAPVVCSNRASLPEVGGSAVAYFDPDSPEELHDALDKALAEGRTPAAVAKRRAQAVKFTWEASAERFARAVREVAGSA